MIASLWETKEFLLWTMWSWETGGSNLTSATWPLRPSEQAIRRCYRSICCPRACRQKTVEGPNMKTYPLPGYPKCAFLTSRTGKIGFTWRLVRNSGSQVSLHSCLTRICILITPLLIRVHFEVWEVLPQGTDKLWISLHSNISTYCPEIPMPVSLPSSIKYNNVT